MKGERHRLSSVLFKDILSFLSWNISSCKNRPTFKIGITRYLSQKIKECGRWHSLLRQALLLIAFYICNYFIIGKIMKRWRKQQRWNKKKQKRDLQIAMEHLEQFQVGIVCVTFCKKWKNVWLTLFLFEMILWCMGYVTPTEFCFLSCHYFSNWLSLLQGQWSTDTRKLYILLSTG